MEKIVMYLKKVIILLCGIVLGYLTSRRTDMSISLECILGDGVFIVLVITIIMVITKEKIKLGINCAIFGLSFVIGSTWIKNIELFFEFGKQNYDYILCGLGEAIIIPVIFVRFSRTVRFGKMRRPSGTRDIPLSTTSCTALGSGSP